MKTSLLTFLYLSEKNFENDVTSFEGSADKEEIFKNFDKGANVIMQRDSSPAKSNNFYMMVYVTYTKQKRKNENSLSD